MRIEIVKVLGLKIFRYGTHILSLTKIQSRQLKFRGLPIMFENAVGYVQC